MTLKTAAARWSTDGNQVANPGGVIPVRVAVCIMEIHIPGAVSLKEKRQVIQSLVKRLRNRFNISISEVGCRDLWQRAELGVAAVCGNSAIADRVMEQLVTAVEQERRINIITSEVEIY